MCACVYASCRRGRIKFYQRKEAFEKRELFLEKDYGDVSQDYSSSYSQEFRERVATCWTSTRLTESRRERNEQCLHSNPRVTDDHLGDGFLDFIPKRRKRLDVHRLRGKLHGRKEGPAERARRFFGVCARAFFYSSTMNPFVLNLRSCV